MKKMTAFFAAAILAVVACGCVSMEYDGKKCDTPTTSVQVFSDADAITMDYEKLGRATASGDAQEISRDRLVEKLVKEAKKCGADAVLIVEQQVIAEEEYLRQNNHESGFDYDETSNGWRQISRDINVNYGNVRHNEALTTLKTKYKRVIRAEFLKYQNGDKKSPKADKPEGKKPEVKQDNVKKTAPKQTKERKNNAKK